MSTPKAVLYTFDGSVWGSAPRLALVEKGYSDADLDIKVVDLIKGENFAPTYLRINSKGTVPSLVVPLLETTSAEVDTKFRALTDSKSILEFLDQSRSQPILDSKGEGAAAPAPVLAPATIEGKAASDAIVKLVHASTADPNALLLGARNAQELKTNGQGLAGVFIKNRNEALKKYQTEVNASSTWAFDGPHNPHSSATVDSLNKWYTQKIESESLLVAAYLEGDAEAAEKLFRATQGIWNGIADTVEQLEKSIKGPYSLGDQMSLADLHIAPWLARVLAVCSQLREGKTGEGEDIDGLDRALKASYLSDHATASNGVGPKMRAWWSAIKQRPSFQAVYSSGLH